MLTLFAGKGRLPGVLIDRLVREERAFRLSELEGHPCEHRGDRPVMRFRIETLGSFLDDLVRYETTEICFAGRVDRPEIDPGRIDAKTEPLIPDLMKALAGGDDGALRFIMRLFETRGIAVVPPHAIAPELLPDEGVLTRRQPTTEEEADATRGVQIIGALGAVDVGQACVVAGGQPLAIETVQGTDWMLATLMPKAISPGEDIDLFTFALMRMDNARRGYGLRDTGAPLGGVLVKAAKPTQDRRIDLPTIGPDTIRRVSAARLSGIVIEEGGVYVLDFESCIDLANSLGLFLWVRR